MKKNVGTIDALLRISLGLFAFGWGISRMVRKPYSAMPFFITLMASQKIAEGITRFCPGLALLGLNTRDVKKERKMPPSTNYYARRKIEPPLTAPTQFERGDIHE